MTLTRINIPAPNARVPFGHQMRDTQFLFSSSYTPLNHGSFGAYPRPVHDAHLRYQKMQHERPSKFIVYDLPDLIDTSRAAVAPLLGCHVDEVVLIPNATTGINIVLRNLKWDEDGMDTVVYFSTIYPACEKTLISIQELGGNVGSEAVEIEFPISEDEIVERFKAGIEHVRRQGKRVRLAMFDTVLTFPGVRMPWERLVGVCKEEGVLSLIDGAHGIGQINLTHLGSLQPDFFVSNCHKWLYTPRSVAVFYVPFQNQHLIRTSIPTSHGYIPPSSSDYANYDFPGADEKSPFVLLFQFVATIDYTPYLCVPDALAFRSETCGGEEEIRRYCFDLARRGGDAVAGILGRGSHRLVSGEGGDTMTECCFAMVALPLTFEAHQSPLRSPAENLEERSREQEIATETAGLSIEPPPQGKVFRVKDASVIARWINFTAVREFDTYLQVGFHSGYVWVRISAQVYLEVGDFEWVGEKLKELCERIEVGEVGL